MAASGIAGLTVVITGAGRGLGAALAVVMADKGAQVVLAGRSAAALAETATAIDARTGHLPPTVMLDLADPSGAEQAAASVVERFGTVDVLVNNGAGWLAHRDAPYTAVEVATTVASAVTGTFLFTQGLIPALMLSRRPDVVTIGSISGLDIRLHDTAVPFYAAKHGQRGLIEGLRQRFIDTPIRSIGIHPPYLEDVSPLDPAWDDVPSRGKAAGLTNRDVVEAVLYAVTRPRHVTVASLILDADEGGIYGQD